MLPEGLYEQVISKALDKKLSEDNGIKYDAAPIDNAEAPSILSKYIAEIVEKGLMQVQGEDISGQLSLANKIISAITEVTGDEEFDGNSVEEKAQQLLAVVKKQNNIAAVTDKIDIPRPETSLSASSLFTGSLNEPSMMTELKKEICSADRVDMLVSFIKWSGLRLIINELNDFTMRGGKLRIITTSYMGATDVKAVEELRKLPNTEIKISYDTKRTRLHAKSYVFYRNTGFTTAYIGSSNLSNAAISSGLEWNLKITAQDQPDTIKKINATFDSYWNSAEFSDYSENDVDKLAEALSAEKYSFTDNDNYSFDINPYPYQQEILDSLQAERKIRGHSRGAAVSGIIATYLIADGYKVFAYNFATPNQVETYNKSDIVTPGVFNLVNTDDLIPQLPLKNTWNFYKYGYTIPMNFSPNMERVWHTRVSFWYNQTSQYMIDSVLQSFSNMCSERNKCYYFDENDNSMIKKYDIIDYLPAYNFYNNRPPHIKETIEISYEDGFFIVKQKPIYFMQVLAGVAAEDKHFNKYTFGLLQFYNAPKYNDANISMTVISMLGMKNPHFVDSYIILCEKAG